MTNELSAGDGSQRRHLACALGCCCAGRIGASATAMAEALRPFGVELRHFAVLLVVVERGPTERRDLVEATGFDEAGIMRVVDDLERQGLAVREADPGLAGAGHKDHQEGIGLFDAAHWRGRDG